MENIEPDFSKINIERPSTNIKKKSHSNLFHLMTQVLKQGNPTKTKYKLPDINYLEKNYLNLVLMEIKIVLTLSLWKKYY